jgi:hypothetical protein
MNALAANFRTLEHPSVRGVVGTPRRAAQRQATLVGEALPWLCEHYFQAKADDDDSAQRRFP